MTNLEPICKSTERIRFGPKAVSLLQPTLTERQSGCSEVYLDKPMLLMLDSQFNTLSGHNKLTQQAFKEICLAISPKLYGAVVDVSAFSKAEASIMFSMAVKAAFNMCLNGKTIRVNRSNEIVALTAHKDSGYTNDKFFDYLTRTVDLCKSDMAVDQAVLDGEKLSVFVKYAYKPVKKLKGFAGDAVYSFKIDNKNEQSFKANSLVVKLGKLGVVSFNTCTDGSLKERLYYGLNLAKIFDDNLQIFVRKANGHSLRFTGDKSKDDYRAKELRTILVSVGVPADAATTAIKRTFYSDRASVKEKNFFDLFVSVLSEQSGVGTTAKAKNKIARAMYRLIMEREALRG
jgi:hypothetical protein